MVVSLTTLSFMTFRIKRDNLPFFLPTYFSTKRKIGTDDTHNQQCRALSPIPSSATSSFWVEALHTAVHILNILPSKAIQNKIPYSVLFNKPVSYSHLKVFGSLCFPNTNNSHKKKLSPRSRKCIFLGYTLNHRGYICFDLTTKKIIISRHVNFHESCFPYEESKTKKDLEYDFLSSDGEPSPLFRQILETTTVPATAPPSVDSPTCEAPTQSSQVVREEPRHAMSTRSKHGISKPKQILSLHAQTQSPLPKSYLKALDDPNWNPAMNVEYDAFIKNKTFDLVPRPPNTNVVTSMWLYKHKYVAEGFFKNHKARLVANGKSQEQGIDFDETFSPVVKPATIRTVLHVALMCDWQVHQLDVQNAFLHGTLDETVYMTQIPGYVDKTKPDHVCKLSRSIYGLKQAPRAWNARFVTFITSNGFTQCKSDTSLFVYRKGDLTAYLILYVDDIIVTASTDTLRQTIISLLKSEFPMTDSGRISSFLGISAKFNEKGLFLSQAKYAEDIIHRAGMSDCKPCATPVDLKSKLAEKDGKPVPNPTEYRSLAGALQYLTFTRPDLSYAV